MDIVLDETCMPKRVRNARSFKTFQPLCEYNDTKFIDIMPVEEYFVF